MVGATGRESRLAEGRGGAGQQECPHLVGGVEQGQGVRRELRVSHARSGDHGLKQELAIEGKLNLFLADMRPKMHHTGQTGSR